MVAMGIAEISSRSLREGNRGSHFPFWGFRLFAYTINPMVNYDLLIYEADGIKFQPPVDMPTFRRRTQKIKNVSPAHLLYQAGVHWVNGDRKKFHQIRATIEENYFNTHQALRYEFVKRSWDPVKRYQTGEIKSTEVLDVFERGPQ